MLDGIRDVLNFFTSSEHKISKKIVTFVVCLSTILFIDYFFRFSDSYITDNKLEQLEKVENLLSKERIDNNIRGKLYKLENEISDRTTFWNETANGIIYIKNSISSILNTPTSINKPLPEKDRSFIYHVISSSWTIILLMILMPFVVLKNVKKDVGNVIMFLFQEFILLAMAIVSSYLFALIPIIWSPVINYILNATLAIGIPSGVAYFFFKNKGINPD